MFQFLDMHREELKDSLTEPVLDPHMGFPDCGSGRYSEKLDYKDWYDFNNAQRVHMNYVEQLPLIMALIFISALT
jgi:hypothetical protein